MQHEQRPYTLCAFCCAGQKAGKEGQPLKQVVLENENVEHLPQPTSLN